MALRRFTLDYLEAPVAKQPPFRKQMSNAVDIIAATPQDDSLAAEGKQLLQQGLQVRSLLQSLFCSLFEKIFLFYNYEYLWRRYVEPALGHLRLQDVRKADCMGLLRAAVAKAAEDNRELKRTTLQRIKAFLTSFFSYAVDELSILAANPTLGKIPNIGHTKETETYAYSEGEMKQIRDAVSEYVAKEHRDLANTLLTVASYTSLSKSELAGLDWEDFDPVEKVLYVRRSRVEGRLGHTKTKARLRKQPLNMITTQQLLQYKSKTLGTGPIFCGITGSFDGRPLNFKYFEMVLKAALKRANLQWQGWHAFRRAFATNLYHKNVNEVTVQSLMGHKEGSTITREHYIKPQDDSARAAVTLLN